LAGLLPRDDSRLLSISPGRARFETPAAALTAGASGLILVRMAAAPPIAADFQLMAKPMGPRCNLACVYCFYRGKEALYPDERHWKMRPAVLEAYVRQYLACLHRAPEVTFAWQGGEPTLAGLDFYKRAVALQRAGAPPGRRIGNSLQTNGILLDDAWCRFLRDENFLVGLSLDGPPELHDPYRVFPDGRPTAARVLDALARLRRHGVEFNVLCSVHRLNAARPREVYEFLREHGVKFMQFIPIVVPAEGAPGAATPESVTPELWGGFLCEIFDVWVRRDVGAVFVQAFDMTLAAWTGRVPPLCVMNETCGRALILEHNGDVYSCDHFATPDHRLGNILQRPLAEIVNSPRQAAFARDKRDRRPASCRACRYDFACRGECPKNRLAPPPGEDQPRSWLCSGYFRFFEHSAPFMGQMAEALARGLPAAVVMRQFGNG